MANINDYQYDVFLSHSSEDAAKVRLLAQRLREHGISCWLDEEQIKPGDFITDKIQNGLVQSRWIIVALSRSAGASPWCRSEYQPFLHKEIKGSQTRVIPVLLETMADDDIPVLLFDKSRVNLGEKDGFQRLVGRVHRPLTIDDYCERIRGQPLISGWLFNGDYQIEPSDLLRIELREVDFHFGDPVRAIRSGKTLNLDSFVQEVIGADSSTTMKVMTLLGEAGVGKTTTCKWLCRLLAESSTSLAIVPLYVALGEWDSQMDFEPMLDQQVGIGTFDELITAVHQAGYRLIFFLDGWNEQESGNLKHVKAFLRKRTGLQNAIVVLTSRPVAAVDTMWEGMDIRFFEIRRWTEQQLESYFKRNQRAELFAQIPKEALNCLRLPLLAFLLLRRLDHDEPLPSLRTVSDVFAYVLDQFLESDEEKNRAILHSRENLTGQPKMYLEQLAYQMTTDNVIQTVGISLENLLSEVDRSQFKLFLARMVNSGLLRCSNAMVALDPNANLDELRGLKISFLHQAFQEYLAAQWLLSPLAPELPPDVSHDAFWREVPVYMIQSFAGSVERQKKFALVFLQGDAPDYLTGTRLANEIIDPAVSQSTKQQIVAKLMANIEEPGMYPYAIETCKALGVTGRNGLRANLSDVSLLTRTYARAEAHLVGGSVEGADEEAWRRLGRSIYLLGELGDFWLAGHLDEHLDSIRSLHLLYHIGEALLTLAREPELSREYRETILTAGRNLEKHARGDSVVQSYAVAVVRTCSGEADDQAERAQELRDFLYRQTDSTRQHFPEEFWRRAHGSEAFAEVADPSISADALLELFETENTAAYGDYTDGDYRQVQSSILKAVLRSCDLYPGTGEQWRPLLERIFQSERISANGWACRHLERLLLKWFTGQKALAWIKEWKESKELGGSRILNVLSNVIWLTS